MFLADAQIVLEEADCPVLTRRDRDRCREHITELAQWAGSGAELGFKREVQNISSCICAGISSHNSSNYGNFLAWTFQ